MIQVNVAKLEWMYSILGKTYVRQTDKNRNKPSTASLSATFQKGCPNRVYSPDRVQTEPNYRKQCKHKWSLLLGHQLFMLIAATCPCQCKRATIYMHVALSCVRGDKDNSYSTGAQGQSDKAVVCLHTVQNRWVNTAPTAQKFLTGFDVLNK